jgi:predicted acyl esterase
MSEQSDTQAIVRWMREQVWYPGEFATFGASYLGYTQFALLEDPPEDLIASVILCGPHDQARHTWYKGAYRMDRVSWAYMVAHQEDDAPQSSTEPNLSAAVERLKTVMGQVPIRDAVEHHFYGRASYVLDFMTTPDIGDPFWYV